MDSEPNLTALAAVLQYINDLNPVNVEMVDIGVTYTNILARPPSIMAMRRHGYAPISDDDVYPQVTDRTHIPTVTKNAPQLCDICYAYKNTFCTCSVCKNETCADCTHRVDKCPFCRVFFSVK